jgi:hypothetical protein
MNYDALKKRQRVFEIDRSRLCPYGPHADDLDWVCVLCSNRGYMMPEEMSQEAKDLGAEPLPPDHPARERETYMPGIS